MKYHPLELNKFSVFTTALSWAKIWPVKLFLASSGFCKIVVDSNLQVPVVFSKFF